MRLALAALFAMLLCGSALACEIGDPFPFNSDENCSPAAQALMQRIGGCLNFADEEAYNKKRGIEIARAMKDMRCDRLTCDFDAMSRDDHAMVKAYIERSFTDEPEFRGTFPPTKSCKAPLKPKAKTGVKKSVVKSTAKQPIKSSSGVTVKTKSAPSPKPVKKKQEK